MASIVKQTKRKAGVVLKSKTSGVIQGAKMVDVERENYGGAFSVQVATEPVMPETNKGFFTDWYKQFIIDGLLLEVKNLSTFFSTNAMTEYVICQEKGRGFMKYGYYRRVFVNSEGNIDNSDGDKSEGSVRYVNLWTGAVDLTCNFGSLTDCAHAQQVCREWNTWMAVHQFTNKELGLLEVYTCLLFSNGICNC
jgi:hypothetical protein